MNTKIVAQEILSSKGNLMLIENSVMKIEKSVKSISDWAENLEDLIDASPTDIKHISEKIKSNAASIIKEIAEIKKEF
jgi:hypothetical protein